MSSTLTPNLQLEIPSHGDYASTGWDNPMDNSLRSLDTAYGGVLSLTLSGGATQLTFAQASNPIIQLSGTLSSDALLYFPPVAGRRIIIQGVNLNGHLLYVRGNNGTDGNGIYFWTSFGIPYAVTVTPSRVYWDYGGVQPGTLADMPVGFAGNGWLPCDGRWVSMSLHDLLYYTIGGTWGISGSYPSGAFKLPDYRGTTLSMADQIGTVPGSGPLASNAGSRGILNNWGITVYAGEAYHQISVAEMPGHDHGYSQSPHGHAGRDLGHTHPVPGGFGYGIGGVYPPNPHVNTAGNNINTAPGYGNIQIDPQYANINFVAQGGWQAHNNIQPTTTTMTMIRW